jgi:hypothetical protein
MFMCLYTVNAWLVPFNQTSLLNVLNNYVIEQISALSEVLATSIFKADGGSKF